MPAEDVMAGDAMVSAASCAAGVSPPLERASYQPVLPLLSARDIEDVAKGRMSSSSSALCSWRRATCAAALVGVGTLMLLSGGLRTTVQRQHAAPAMRPRASVIGEVNVEPKVKELCDSCCESEDDVFLPGNDVEKLTNVSSADQCCTYCRAHELCLAWTWVKPGNKSDAKVCYLKGGLPRPLSKVASLGHVSGQTLQTNKVAAPLKVNLPAEGQSLYCFSLIQPEGYEKGLIKMQYDEGASIFQCDEYGLYSNRRMELAPMVFTSVVNSTLKCPMGGEFGTALNTGIFLAVWAQVIADGRFLFHDWTVKVDPDSVFLPSRLRHIVKDHEEDEKGVYLNNCKFGLHGPLEVFSRNAVKRWALGAGKCVHFFWKLCSGPCGWGEDMFIDQCLKRKLDVQRDDDFRQLKEDHCSPPKGWEDCHDPTAAAFHPFKSKKGWKTCLAATEKSAKNAKKSSDASPHHSKEEFLVRKLASRADDEGYEQ